MNNLFWVFFVLLVGLALRVQADSSFFSAQDKLIYDETVKVCQETKTLSQVILNRNNLNGFLISTGQFLTLTFGLGSQLEQVPKLTQNYLLSDYAADRLQSFGFIMAMKKCFPNDPQLHSAFVVSMLAADTLGKVPAILSAIYTLKISRLAWGSLAAHYPKLARYLGWSSLAGVALVSVLEARTQMKRHQLTDFEKERLSRIKSGMNESIQESGRLIREFGLEEIQNLQVELEKTNDEVEKAKINAHILRIQEAISKI